MPRCVSLVQLEGGKLALRLQSSSGERMATHLRPFTLQDISFWLRARPARP